MLAWGNQHKPEHYAAPSGKEAVNTFLNASKLPPPLSLSSDHFRGLQPVVVHCWRCNAKIEMSTAPGACQCKLGHVSPHMSPGAGPHCPPKTSTHPPPPRVKREEHTGNDKIRKQDKQGKREMASPSLSLLPSASRLHNCTQHINIISSFISSWI